MENKKNKIEEKYIEEITKDLNSYIENEGPQKNIKLDTNIGKPLMKIIITLLLTLCFISFISNKNSKIGINDYIYKIEGTWIDEKDNHYEIKGTNFEMNAGKKDLPFYKGTITKIIETDLGYKILIRGNKYDISNNVQENEEELNFSLEILEYTSELKVPMKVKINDNELNMIKVE